MRLRFPHPLVLLLGAVVVAALLTWILPAGRYDRRADPATGRDVVVAGTYERVEASPQGIADAAMAVPKGIVAGADIIVVILIVGGAFAVLDSTGALGRMVNTVAARARRPRTTVIAVSVLCATFGALVHMQEEFIALMPVLVLLSLALGYGAITAIAMSAGAATVGAAFGPTNPFGGGLASRVAEAPVLSDGLVKLGVLIAAVSVWIAWTLYRARDDDDRPPPTTGDGTMAMTRDYAVVTFAFLPFFVYVWGLLRFDWGFNELSALYLVTGFGIGLASRLSITGTTERFLRGMESMLAAGLFVGVARAISVVLTDGLVIDTIVSGLVAPLSAVSSTAAALILIPIQAILHIPVPSSSGQAVLTMPIMAPTADLLGFTREAAVMAYQTGALPIDLISPTNGALLAILLKAKVGYGRWVRFAGPGMLLVMGVGVVGVLVLV